MLLGIKPVFLGMALQIWSIILFQTNLIIMWNKKFQDFSPVDKQSWIDQAVKDLKGEDFQQQLITQTMEGFSLFPFYTSEDTKATEGVKNYENLINHLPFSLGIPPRVWTNAVEVKGEDEKALNREIRFVLDNGADGLIVDLSGNEDLRKVFQDVLPQFIQFWIRPINKPIACLDAFYSWVSSESIPCEQVNGGLLWDRLAQGFTHRINLEDQIEEAFIIHELSQPFPNFKSICVDTSVYHNAGAHAVQDIGYGMAALVELIDGLTERGAYPDTILQDIFIYTAVGSSYFMEIAKLKTFRIALNQLAGLYQVVLKPEDIQLFAVGSGWSKSSLEPYNNLLRNTTEAMSAIIGGCNTLFIEPHDKWIQSPDRFSKRMARNISNILKEESYFDKTVDPSAGSYYMENLIHLLREHSFQLLKTVEEEGGWWKLYQKNKIQTEIKNVRKEKFNHLIQGEYSIIGVNSAWDAEQKKILAEDDVEEAFQLKSFSQTYPFDSTI